MYRIIDNNGTLYNEYQYNAAFAVASILTVIAIINLIIKNSPYFMVLI